jgi:NADPH2:quinone reductase
MVKASGVNPADTYNRSGIVPIKLPFTPGTDGAGIVESTGKGVKSFKAGDRVYLGRSVSGTYAEYALATESQVHMLPGNVTFQQGAGIYVPYATAYYALHYAAEAKKGEIMLVHGASGGVGIAAVQMARALDLTIFGTAGTPGGRKLARSEGAHEVFDHTETGYRDRIMKSTGGKGVDIILEMLANVNLGHDLKLIGTRGRIVIIGSRGDTTVTPRDLMAKMGTVRGMMIWNITAGEAAIINEGIEAGLIDGTIKPVIRKEFSLKDAGESHRLVMTPGASGKIVLIP